MPDHSLAMTFDRRQLHSSVTSHLVTELAVLSSLLCRSKEQHRSQIFLQRARGVYRLGRQLQAALVESDNPGPQARLARLVFRLLNALVVGSSSTSQIIELHYFLPLHILLLSVYARIFAIAVNFASALQSNVENILAGRLTRSPHAVQLIARGKGLIALVRDKRAELTDIELGTKVERAAASGESRLLVIPQTLAARSPDVLEFVASNPTPEQPRRMSYIPENHKRSLTEAKPSQPVKRKRYDAMDDIFGF